MSVKNNNAGYSPDRTDTMIGAGMRIDGNISFAGVLRIQGNVLGDVSCDTDPRGAMVADSAGSVTGMVKAPNVVVRGRVQGTVHSFQSIQVQEDACVVGDVYYKEVEIHKGGIIEGVLTPDYLGGAYPGHEQRIQASDSPAGNEYLLPLAAGNRLGGLRRGVGFWPVLGAAIMLVVVFAVVWLSQAPVAVKLPADNFALRAEPSLKEAGDAPSTPVASVRRR